MDGLGVDYEPAFDCVFSISSKTKIQEVAQDSVGATLVVARGYWSSPAVGGTLDF